MSHTLFRVARRALLLPALITPLVLTAANVRVYVQYGAGKKAAAQAAISQAGGGSVHHHHFDDLNALVVTMPEQAKAALQRNPAIAFIEEDPVRGFLANTQTTPYGITMVQAPQVVASGATGAGFKVGVIDSGAYDVHEDLQAVTITGEPDFGPADQRTWYRDINSHGTHVVGTLAAANNSVGVVGVSPGALGIHMVKVFGDTGGWVYSSDLLAAARAAAIKGCRIISMSLGGGRSSRTENLGLTDLYTNRGVLLIAAAGNDGNTAVSYPAGYASVVSVGAIDSTKAVASFSQKNSDVELAAPGVAVLSTVSYIDSSTVAVGKTNATARHVEFSGRGTVSGQLVFGGLGDTANPAWSGKVVLVDRGSVDFYTKVHNVELSGGVACVIANNVSGGFSGTLGEGRSSTIPAVSVSMEDGATLKPLAGTTATVASTLTQPANGYDLFDGTSMATPHVSGVAALIWSKYPGATNAQVRQALTSTAEDLGTPGRDTSFGFGLVRAQAALSALAAMNPATPTDTAAPLISAVTANVTNAKNGSFTLSWVTDEAATTDVQLNASVYTDSALTTSHSRSFRGTRGATYTYVLSSTDAAGNTATSGPHSITIN